MQFQFNSDSSVMGTANVAERIEAMMRTKFVRFEDRLLGALPEDRHWLIGFRGSVPSEARSAIFEGVDWSTAAVLAQSVERVTGAGLSLTLLPVWYDIDSADDVEMLRGHLKAMAAAGEDVVLCRHGKPLVRITRLATTSRRIRFGALRGKVKMAPDFDAPLPPEVLAAFTGR